MRSLLLLLFPLSLAACTTTGPAGPSLAPRAGEAIDPRVPIPANEPVGAVTPALATRLAELEGAARAAGPAVEAALDVARVRVAAAGAAQSESWIVAQQAVSAAVAARAPVTRALAEIDGLGASALVNQGGLTAADRLAIEAASARVGQADSAQAAAIAGLQARLGG